MSAKLLDSKQVLYHLSITLELLPSGLVRQNSFDLTPVPLSLSKTFPWLFYIQMALMVLYLCVTALFLLQVG